MDGSPQVKWYFKTSFLIVLFLSIGPFALPLLWLHPRFSKRSKAIVTIIVIALTVTLGIAVVNSIKSITDFYKGMNNELL
ncbi:MAG: hypothetical protein AB1530_06410 [Candidatus Omnitrophota bacterium]